MGKLLYTSNKGLEIELIGKLDIWTPPNFVILSEGAL